MKAYHETYTYLKEARRPKRVDLPIPKYERVIELIKDIDNPKHQEIFSALYLSGKRGQERIIQVGYIKEEQDRWIVIHIETKKHRQKPRRIVEINAGAESYLASVMWRFKNNLEEKDANYYQLTNTPIRYLMKKYFAWPLKDPRYVPHDLRRWRCNHIQWNYRDLGLPKHDIWDMKHTFGWARISSAEAYMYESPLGMAERYRKEKVK